jgi:hypothetical protein
METFSDPDPTGVAAIVGNGHSRVLTWRQAIKKSAPNPEAKDQWPKHSFSYSSGHWDFDIF